MGNTKKWYAIYVKSRSEKKVSADLERINVEYYLPLNKVLKQWSDRKKWVEEPLFRCYIFVYIDQTEYYKVLQVFNVVKYIAFEGNAVAIPPQQIEAIRYYLNENPAEETDDVQWETGQKVEIISGSLSGLKGELIEIRGKHRLNIEIEAVGKSILIQIPKNKLRII